jgi:hypothetical protein
MGDPDSEIILEINRMGGAIEVRAISTGDGLEVSFAAPIHAPKGDLERLARTKLAYVRSKRGGGQGGPDHDPDNGRGGILA